ncbi:type III-B CRISPR module RAMP protein Cmr1, partial [Chloroflexus sp.]|uniref:type III-B CRISPR module RAMP protein Cmr1 n=1 Tax=Chloroflexus sp. TaxID=1904827 RepID=UPI00404B9BE8
MELKIATLTPLWTGGIDGKVDRIHETGILGSLRWWYEAIVRGLGGEACDPSAGTCRFDAEQYAASKAADERQRLRDAGLCDVCQVFGATGWRRRFRV